MITGLLRFAAEAAGARLVQTKTGVSLMPMSPAPLRNLKIFDRAGWNRLGNRAGGPRHTGQSS
jgi:hypothetical protein